MRKSIILPFYLFALFLAFSCANESKLPSQFSYPTEAVPTEKFSVNPQTADTIVTATGSIITFPKNSILTKNGDPITGNVTVTVEEYLDPFDFLANDMPLEYDSNSTEYLFESAAMSEIRAFANGEECIVNKQAQPTVYLAAAASEKDFNLYALDTNTRQWTNIGKDEVIDAKAIEDSLDRREEAIVNRAEEGLVKPLKPKENSEDLPTLEIEIEPGVFKELEIYENMLFAIDTTDYKTIENDAKMVWIDVKVERSAKNGCYNLRFVNAEKVLNLEGYPVFEGENYQEALRVFNEKIDSYSTVRTNRIKEERRLAKEREEELRKKEAERLEAFRKQQLLMKRRIEEAQKEITANTNNRKNILRSFQIESFGVFNCDRPIFRDRARMEPVFVNEQGETLDVQQISIAYFGLNTLNKLTKFDFGVLVGEPAVLIVQAYPNWYFMSTKDFKKQADMARLNKKVRFNMKLPPNNQNKKEMLKSFVY